MSTKQRIKNNANSILVQEIVQLPTLSINMEWTAIWGIQTQKQLDICYVMEKSDVLNCHEVNILGMRAYTEWCMNISAQWAEGNVTSYGSTREIQLSSLRKKIHEHKNSQAHKEAICIFYESVDRKTYCLIWMHKVNKLPFNPLLKFSGWTAVLCGTKITKPFTDFESLIDLQQANLQSDIARVLSSVKLLLLI